MRAFEDTRILFNLEGHFVGKLPQRFFRTLVVVRYGYKIHTMAGTDMVKMEPLAGNNAREATKKQHSKNNKGHEMPAIFWGGDESFLKCC